jgi:hypothetical protein
MGCGDLNHPGEVAYDGSTPASDISAKPPDTQASKADLRAGNGAPSSSAASTPDLSRRGPNLGSKVGKAKANPVRAQVCNWSTNRLMTGKPRRW